MTKKYILDDLNKDQHPGDDFYDYAIGGWLKNNRIPDDYSRYGSFESLVENNFKKLTELLNDPEKIALPEDKELAKKIGIFFHQGMNIEEIEKIGIGPLKTFFEKIARMNDRQDLLELTSQLHTLRVPVLFNFFSAPDAKNSRTVIGALGQGGLGLYERNYYLGKENDEIRKKYFEHIKKMFTLLEMPDASQKAEAAIRIETELAKISRTKEEMRDPVKNYNKMQRRQLVDITPEFHWQEYFLQVGAEEVIDVDVGQPDFFAGLNHLLSNAKMSDWQAYFSWQLILHTADYLPESFVQEKFDFYGKTLQGQPKMKDRLKRVIITLDQHIGEAIGKIYVAKFFPPEAKLRAEKLVENITEAMGERIENLSWMSDETKKLALKKLRAIDVKIGYPNKWRDFSKWDIGQNYLDSILKTRRFEWEREMYKIGKPVDRTEWIMSPQTVNAYYEPQKNEIVFPAGILQAPFFSNDADDALNYGGIGSVIGHEITHGFDDQGRQFDSDGNLQDWWTEEDANKFKNETAKLVEQYNAVEVLPGVKINGEFTLGENIADLGGLCVAFQALKKIPELVAVDGLTPEQRFFISYAQTEKGHVRDEKLKMQIMTDPHSPQKYRVNITVSNADEFFEAFSITSGKLFREKIDRVKIW